MKLQRKTSARTKFSNKLICVLIVMGNLYGKLLHDDDNMRELCFFNKSSVVECRIIHIFCVEKSIKSHEFAFSLVICGRN